MSSCFILVKNSKQLKSPLEKSDSINSSTFITWIKKKKFFDEKVFSWNNK